MVKGTCEKSDLSVAGGGVWVDRKGCRQETVGTQSFEGVPERLKRGQGKKRDKDLEDGGD